jgi:hypothetical protein
MLDVHLPHGKLHGISDFLIHLFTITVGLLIAVQIESCVEWRHHVHLANEARVELRTEIEHNLADLKKAEPSVKIYRQKIDDDLAILQRIQEHRNVTKEQRRKFSVSSGGVGLTDTAWKTAQITGALAYMPYEEAERYSEIYQAQDQLRVISNKPVEDAAAITGLLAKFHRGPGKITVDQASAMAEQLGQMRLHMAIGDTNLHVAIEQCEAFLEHRKARDDFETNLKSGLNK